jgi:hypothetical protein
MNGHLWQTIRQRQVSGSDGARETAGVRPARLQRDLFLLAADRKAARQREDLIPTARRLAASPAGHDSVLRLQRYYGNQCVQKILRARNEPEDRVTRPQVEDAIVSARGGGAALESGVRAQMESSFGADFSGVRIHDNSQADDLNRSLSARAFTTGTDIFFRQGEYRPGSSEGRRLLAHELTHVVQQNSDEVGRSLLPGSVQARLTVSEPHDPLEREADRMSHLVMEQEQKADKTPSRVAVPEEEQQEQKHLHRQKAGDEDELQAMPQPEAEEEERKQLS